MIYTAITGGKDKPRDDIKCFSEEDRFKDPTMNAKIYKVLSHLYDPDEYSVWVDGTVIPVVEIEKFIELLGDAEIAVFSHPNRDCIYDEADECKRLNLDSFERLTAHTDRYRGLNYPEHAGLGACYVIIRKHTERIKRLNEQWWAEICHGSRRDQISFPFVFGDVVKYLPWVQNNNEYFHRGGHLR